MYKEKLNRFDLLAIGFIAFFILCYSVFYLFQFITPQDGWHNILARNILDNKLLYKDVFFNLPPLFPYLSAFWIDTFGDSLLTLKVVGIVERLIIFSLVYLLLRKISLSATALVCTILGFVFYANMNADFIYNFYQTTIFFGIISLFCLLEFISLKFTQNKHCKYQDFLLFLSGFCASLSFLTKQSSGFFIIFAICLILGIFQLLNHKFSLKQIIIMVAGIAIPLALCIAFLVHLDLLYDCLNSVFKGAMNSKGDSMGNILFGFVFRFILSDYLFPVLGGVLLVAIPVIAYDKRTPPPSGSYLKDKDDAFLLLVFGITLFLILVGVKITVELMGKDSFIFVSFKQNILCNAIFYFLLFLSAYTLCKQFFRKKKIEHSEQIFLYMSIFSLCVLYAHGLSLALEEHGCFLALPLVLLWLLKQNFFKLFWIRIFLLSLLLCFMTALLYSRYTYPINWWGWAEKSIFYSDYPINHPQAFGIKSSHFTAEFLNEVVPLLQQKVSVDEYIYAFPAFNLLYYLSKKKPLGFTTFPTFDIYPDKYAQKEAALLRTSPPKVIIYMDFPEPVWRFNEKYFRGYKKSGQRDIKDSILSLINDSKQGYKLFRRYESAVSYYPIYVWYKE